MVNIDCIKTPIYGLADKSNKDIPFSYIFLPPRKMWPTYILTEIILILKSTTLILSFTQCFRKPVQIMQQLYRGYHIQRFFALTRHPHSGFLPMTQQKVDCWGALTVESTFIYDFVTDNYCCSTFIDYQSIVKWFSKSV